METHETRGLSASLDTSHLKVPFPFKSRYGNFINGKFVERAIHFTESSNWSIENSPMSGTPRLAENAAPEK